MTSSSDVATAKLASLETALAKVTAERDQLSLKCETLTIKGNQLKAAADMAKVPVIHFHIQPFDLFVRKYGSFPIFL